MRFCTNCGFALIGASRYCHGCGILVGESSDSGPSVTTASRDDQPIQPPAQGPPAAWGRQDVADPWAAEEPGPPATGQPDPRAAEQRDPWPKEQPDPPATARPDPWAGSQADVWAGTPADPRPEDGPSPWNGDRTDLWNGQADPRSEDRPDPWDGIRSEPWAEEGRPEPWAGALADPLAGAQPAPWGGAQADPDPRSEDRPASRDGAQTDPRLWNQLAPGTSEQADPRSDDRPVPWAGNRPAPWTGTQTDTRADDRSARWTGEQADPRSDDRSVPWTGSPAAPWAGTPADPRADDRSAPWADEPPGTWNGTQAGSWNGAQAAPYNGTQAGSWNGAQAAPYNGAQAGSWDRTQAGMHAEPGFGPPQPPPWGGPQPAGAHAAQDLFNEHFQDPRQAAVLPGSRPAPRLPGASSPHSHGMPRLPERWRSPAMTVSALGATLALVATVTLLTAYQDAAHQTAMTRSQAPSPSASRITQPSPASSATVVIAPAVAGQPQAHQVAAFLKTYFAAINSRNYLLYSRLFIPQMRESAPHFAAGYRSTIDSNATLAGVSTIGGQILAATVAFISRQDPADSPDHAACDKWNVVLALTPADPGASAGTGYVITRSPVPQRATAQACG